MEAEATEKVGDNKNLRLADTEGVGQKWDAVYKSMEEDANQTEKGIGGEAEGFGQETELAKQLQFSLDSAFVTSLKMNDGENCSGGVDSAVCDNGSVSIDSLELRVNDIGEDGKVDVASDGRGAGADDMGNRDGIMTDSKESLSGIKRGVGAENVYVDPEWSMGESYEIFKARGLECYLKRRRYGEAKYLFRLALRAARLRRPSGLMSQQQPGTTCNGERRPSSR